MKGVYEPVFFRAIGESAIHIRIVVWFKLCQKLKKKASCFM